MTPPYSFWRKLFTFCVKVVETPPKNSLTNEFDFIKACIAPIYINFVIKDSEEESMENKINKTIETMI